MFCSRTSNNMINNLHERSLRIILNDYSSDFNILLENNNDICNHHRNIKALNELVPPTMESILNKRFNTYKPKEPSVNQLFFLDRHTYLLIHNNDITIIIMHINILNIAISVNITSNFTLTLLKAMLNGR